jgi:hypothetical protein
MDQSEAKAREMVEQMRRKDDLEGTDTWLPIIVLIGTLNVTTNAPEGGQRMPD